MPPFFEPRLSAASGTTLAALLSGWSLFGGLVLLINRRQRHQDKRCQRLLQASRAELAASRAEVAAAHAAQNELTRRLGELQTTSRLAASVAHEINQPLSAMRLLAEQLRGSAIPLLTRPAAASASAASPAATSFDAPSPDAAVADAVRRSADALGLVAQMELEMDRMVAITEALRLLLRSQDTRIEPLDLTRVVQAALLYLKRPLRDGGIQLSSEGLEQPLTMEGDAQQLQAALIVVLRRVVLALAQSPPAERRLNLCLVPGAETVELLIRASGSWNPAAERPAVLANGEDLDLYVVRITVANHGGEFHSEIGSGGGDLQVRLRLPRRQQTQL
jgi:two-component system C4-dicarboxylate transport sensor histidine kinase DctB